MEAELAAFRAGKLRKEGGMLVPDARKGLVRLVQTEDTLVHVQWYERTAGGGGRAGEAEDDVIVFPGEAALEQIPGQRAVVLRFPEDAPRSAAFWLQEPRPEADAALVAAFNAALNAPRDADADAGGGPSGGGGGGGFDASALTAAAASGIAPTSAVEHAHVATGAGAGAMMGSGGSVVQLPSAPAQTPASTAAVNTQAMSLADILGSAIAAGLGEAARVQGRMGTPVEGREEALAQSLLAQLAAAQSGRPAPAPGPSLADLLRPEVLAPLLRQPSTLQALAQYLPEEHRTPEQLSALAHSPQFAQQLAAFSAALQSGQLDLEQFGLRAAGYSTADFLAAIQEQVDREHAAQQAQHGHGAQHGQGGGGGGAAGGGAAGGGAAPMEG